MTLTQTVSEILKRDVSTDEAKEFANNQFGALCAFIRTQDYSKPIKINYP